MMQKISKDTPFYYDPVYRPPSKPVKIPMSEFPGNMNINLELNTDFEDNSPFQEGVIFEIHQRPDKSFFEDLKNWKVSLIQVGYYRNSYLSKLT